MGTQKHLYQKNGGRKKKWYGKKKKCHIKLKKSKESNLKHWEPQELPEHWRRGRRSRTEPKEHGPEDEPLK